MSNADAQTPNAQTKMLRVATRENIAPFAFREKGQRAGFSIDLWNAIAREMKVKSQFQTSGGVRDLLAQVGAGKADLGIAAVSITSEREKSSIFRSRCSMAACRF